MEFGIDIEMVSRFILDRSSSFISQNFTESEIDFAFSHTKPEIHLCGIFCAKEAVKKTLYDNEIVSMLDIEVQKNINKPLVKLLCEDKDLSSQFKISISHCDDYGVAQAVRFDGN